MSRASISSPPAAAAPAAAAADADKSPGSDVSPLTQVPGHAVGDAAVTTPKPNTGYFAPPATAAALTSTPGTSIASISVEGRRSDVRTEASEETTSSSAASVAASSPAVTAGTPVQDRRPSSVLDLAGEGSGKASRKPSTVSVTFRPPRNPSLPQGLPKQARIQSPAPIRLVRPPSYPEHVCIFKKKKKNSFQHTPRCCPFHTCPRVP